MQQEALGRTRLETRAMQQVTFSPEAEKMEQGQLTMEEWLGERAFVTAVTSDPQEPKTFREAWDHDDPEQRVKWREAIRKEIRLMIEKGVWRFVERKDIPKSRRLVGSKWVFKIKRDGTLRARLVSLGYSQVPRVDFSDNFAPVVNDVTFCIVLTRKLVEKVTALSIDVETASYNVKVLWDTGEITTEPLNMIASDDPVTCAVYAKKDDLLELPGWKRFKHLAKNQKKLTRAINQTKMRQARTTPVYMFGYMVPKDYKEALELEKQNGNSKWYDAVELEMAQIREYNVFKDGGKATFDNHKKVTNAPTDHQNI
ncbi:hypothetical protein ACA910_014674 [Epithemia clementina (nom. ined.)]